MKLRWIFRFAASVAVFGLTVVATNADEGTLSLRGVAAEVEPEHKHRHVRSHRDRLDALLQAHLLEAVQSCIHGAHPFRPACGQRRDLLVAVWIKHRAGPCWNAELPS